MREILPPRSSDWKEVSNHYCWVTLSLKHSLCSLAQVILQSTDQTVHLSKENYGADEGVLPEESSNTFKNTVKCLVHCWQGPCILMYVLFLRTCTLAYLHFMYVRCMTRLACQTFDSMKLHCVSNDPIVIQPFEYGLESWMI